MEKLEGYKAANMLLIVNVAYVTISYLWALITKEYNGDFLGETVGLNNLLLTLVWALSILPFLGVWMIYRIYKKKHTPKKVIFLDIVVIKFFVIGLLIAHIVVTALFGVGKAIAPVYEAPALAKLFIQIILRFDPNIWATFLIFVISKKKHKTIVLILLLVAILGVLKAFMGFIYSFAIILGVKYFEELKVFVRKYLVIVITTILFVPVFVEYIYNQRDVLRGVGRGDVKYEKNTLIAGKLVGRLSSYSNTAIIIDNAPIYFVIAQQFDSFFYVKRMLATIDGARFGQDKSPEQLLKEDTPEGVSFMLGTSGMLIFSLYNSLTAFLVCFISIILISLLLFEIMRRIKFSLNLEFAFLALLGPAVSGVAVEYFFCLLVCFIMFITLLLFRTLKKNIDYKKI